MLYEVCWATLQIMIQANFFQIFILFIYQPRFLRTIA